MVQLAIIVKSLPLGCHGLHSAPSYAQLLREILQPVYVFFFGMGKVAANTGYGADLKAYLYLFGQDRVPG